MWFVVNMRNNVIYKEVIIIYGEGAWQVGEGVGQKILLA